jgi:hypothetical protein
VLLLPQKLLTLNLAQKIKVFFPKFCIKLLYFNFLIFFLIAVTKPNGDKEKSNKPKDTRKDPAPAADLAPVKSAELGARDAGGHGSKQHRENRDKKGRGGKNTDKKGGSVY